MDYHGLSIENKHLVYSLHKIQWQKHIFSGTSGQYLVHHVMVGFNHLLEIIMQNGLTKTKSCPYISSFQSIHSVYASHSISKIN